MNQLNLKCFRLGTCVISCAGVKSTNRMQQLTDFNMVAFEKVLEQVRNGQQVRQFLAMIGQIPQ